ncbi:carboxymuconolactone decarboxylase family protein [uncultured Muribaculum sp.]|uniref:carboxymuconolactone decarboxylase family protein n=1 Tax=uncultured Muribaculum sp. TaxID=1918613 RepID=UPI0026194B9F|nr:carboxymuconolactone decarboxylase family protein [uncultured Muribaculum sp.]
MAEQPIVQTAGRTQLGEFAPEFARLNDDVLFGKIVWNDSVFSLHDHSLITISILLGKGMAGESSFRSHIELGKKHGITRKEIAALLTQAAFYAGWPNAWAGFRVAKEIWAENHDTDNELARFQQEMIFPIGEPNDTFAKYFSGKSWLAPISDEQVKVSNVTFEPGCRNNWHIHKAESGGGQMLIGVAGRGWYQEEGKPAQEILPGMVIHIPANVKHWHGAAADSWFAHLAFSVPGEKSSTEWLEPVTELEYNQR